MLVLNTGQRLCRQTIQQIDQLLLKYKPKNKLTNHAKLQS